MNRSAQSQSDRPSKPLPTPPKSSGGDSAAPVKVSPTRERMLRRKMTETTVTPDALEPIRASPRPSVAAEQEVSEVDEKPDAVRESTTSSKLQDEQKRTRRPVPTRGSSTSISSNPVGRPKTNADGASRSRSRRPPREDTVRDRERARASSEAPVRRERISSRNEADDTRYIQLPVAPSYAIQNMTIPDSTLPNLVRSGSARSSASSSLSGSRTPPTLSSEHSGEAVVDIRMVIESGEIAKDAVSKARKLIESIKMQQEESRRRSNEVL